MDTLVLTDDIIDKEWFIEEFKGRHLSEAQRYLQTEADSIICKTENATLHMQRGGNQYHKIPGPGTLAKNLLTTATAIAYTGLEEAQNKEARLAICNECDCYLPSSDRCAVCGCYVSMKIRYAASHCPKEKW